MEKLLISMALEVHLPALTDAGYDLDTLVGGSTPGTAYLITPQQLFEDTKGSIPIGCCRKIMQKAEQKALEIQKRKAR